MEYLLIFITFFILGLALGIASRVSKSIATGHTEVPPLTYEQRIALKEIARKSKEDSGWGGMFGKD